MESLEIFSGAGGLAKGLELSGFKHAAFVEFNKHACASLKANFDKRKIFCGDIKDYDFSSLSKIDMIAGGPPCQPFSLGGKHGANKDNRDMFPYAISAVETLTPKAFIFENVKGLLRPSFADYFTYIIFRLTFPSCKPKSGMQWQEHLQLLRKISYSSYSDVKYHVSYKLLNAADFGVPQRRERVVIVGVRSDLKNTWNFPAPTYNEEMLLSQKFVTGEYWDRHRIAKRFRETPSDSLKEVVARMRDQLNMFEYGVKPWRTVRDALFGVPDPRHKHSIPDHIFRDGARIYSGHTGSDYDWPAKTIKAGGHGVPGGENMIRFRDGSVRYFTVFEAKLLQTFPGEFVIQGVWGEAMRQIGNAVPVVLAEQLGGALSALLKGTNKSFGSKVQSGRYRFARQA
ncbi:MAG: DNA cytosine methyltransferase [Deltaproteobacteria bacterium]